MALRSLTRTKLPWEANVCCTEPADSGVPTEVAGMLLAYQHLRDPDHGELWGDAAQLWARTFLYRCPFLSPERRLELRGKVVADPGWVDSHDFVTWVRDAVRV